MQEESKLKKVLIIIKKYILIIFLIIGNFFRSLFETSEKETKKDIQNNTQTNKIKEQKKETPLTSTSSQLPDEDNIKSNPHNSNQTNQEDTTNNTDIILEIPKQKLYKVYTQNNELKYLPLNALLDLIIKEELEEIYKIEKFKLKTATSSEVIKVERIKERVFPDIIVKVENKKLRDAKEIREEVIIKLEEDLIKNPLFPPRPKQEEIYTLAKPQKKDLNIKPIQLPKIKEKTKETITHEDKDKLNLKLETSSSKIVMLKTTEEVPTPTLKDNLKDATVIGLVTAAAITNELVNTNELEKENSNSTKNETKKQEINEEEIQLPNKKEEIISQKEEQLETKKIKNEELEETKELNKKDIKEEIKKLEEKNKEELEELKKQIEEKIELIKEEEKKKEQETKKEEKEQKNEEQIKKELKQDKEITEVSEISEEIIKESKEEIKKDDFFEKDYDRIEKQINKMLEDITNTYLKYESKLSEKQKKKLKNEESRLRETKERIKDQKRFDIQVEQKHLEETIKQTEIDGLQSEINFINEENQKEVSNGLLDKMKNFEGVTKEQVANVDKRIMLKRFNKASLLLEMTSLLALPFVRNKYFFHFTIGLIIDNHFNFVNAFFNRKYNRYNPPDISQIKQGQDALNGALDITYKNLVELDYLEQKALSRYPELSYDPKFVNQVTRLRTNLNRKYNNLMNKNKTLEKYRLKAKKQMKILKPELEKKNDN